MFPPMYRYLQRQTRWPSPDQPVFRRLENRARARHGRYIITPPTSLDGTGKHYMGREISDVMGWQASAWLEREERESEERTDLLLQALDLRPGMTVADIGAGTGYLSRLMAPAVLPGGRILAVDVQPMMVRMLQRLTRLDGLGHIEPSRCAEHDVQLPENSVDMAVMLDVYHELACPHEMLASIVRTLKPGARLVFVEFKAEDPDIPIKPLHKMSEARVRREAAVHRLVWECTLEHLPWQHIVMFRKRT